MDNEKQESVIAARAPLACASLSIVNYPLSIPSPPVLSRSTRHLVRIVHVAGEHHRVPLASASANRFTNKADLHRGESQVSNAPPSNVPAHWPGTRSRVQWHTSFGPDRQCHPAAIVAFGNVRRRLELPQIQCENLHGRVLLLKDNLLRPGPTTAGGLAGTSIPNGGSLPLPPAHGFHGFFRRQFFNSQRHTDLVLGLIEQGFTVMGMIYGVGLEEIP